MGNLLPIRNVGVRAVQDVDEAERRLFGDTLVRLIAKTGREDRLGLWTALCEVGVGELGGATGDVVLLATAMAEFGRAGVSPPLIGAFAANAFLADDPATATWLAEVRRGEARVAIVPGELDRDPIAGTVTMADGTLAGAAAGIEDALDATHLLVLIEGGARCALVAVASPEVSIAATPAFARPPLARITFSHAPAEVWPTASGTASHFGDLVRLLLVARASGAQQRGFALVLDHARMRRQFGQPIGQFQAIQHKLADCRVRATLVDLLLEDAIRALGGGGDGARAIATLVSVAAPGLRRNMAEFHHVLGAVGYADEHEAPDLFRRVHDDTVRLGGVRRARELLATRLLDDIEAPVFDIVEPPALAARRASFRDWLGIHWGAAARADLSRNRDADPRFREALGEAGWLAASWREEDGGPGFSGFEQFVFLEEMRGAGAPMTLISPSAWIVGPAFAAFGSPELKQAFLPAIARGDATFCLGYSEPHAGSDLAALTTRAVRDGDDYVVNGQKIWTSLTEYASHIFLAVRTQPAAVRKQEGITVLIVPIDAPGVTIRRMDTLQGKTFANIFLENVRIPVDRCLGNEGDGWRIITSALAAERIIMGGQVANLRGLFQSVVLEARARPDIAADPIVREKLAELAAELDAARSLARLSAALVDRGEPAIVEGAITKLFSGDLAERMGEVLLDLFGVAAALSAGAQDALVGGAVNQHVRTALMLVIGGGTAEIQRTIIAQRGLGLPR